MLIIEGETSEQFHKRQREKYLKQYKIMDKILVEKEKKQELLSHLGVSDNKYFNRLKSNKSRIRYYQLVKQNFLKSKIDREELVERNNNLAAAWRYFDVVIESSVRREI